MKTNEYKRAVRVTLSPVKVSKQGIRANLRKAVRVNIGHAMSGVVSETLELQTALASYLSGAQQMNDTLRDAARDEFGDLLYYVAVGARDLKVKLPTSTKKVKSPGTPTEQVLTLGSVAMDLASLQKKQYYGQEWDLDRIRQVWSNLVHVVWGVSLSLFGEAPDKLMDENITKLKTRYPDAQWSLASVQNKNKASEQKAVAESKAG